MKKRYKMKSNNSKRKFKKGTGVHRANRTSPNMRTGTRL